MADIFVDPLTAWDRDLRGAVDKARHGSFLWQAGLGRRLRGEFGVGFDFDQHARIDEPFHLDHGGGWANVSQQFGMSAANLLPHRNIGDVEAYSHHIGKGCTSLMKGAFDVAERLYGLRVGISDADDLASFIRGSCAGDIDSGAEPHSAAVADD